MKKKTMIALAALLACGQGAWADPTEHFTKVTGVEEGTEALPFLIENIDDLNNLAADVNSGTDYSGKFFKLTQNLDYNGKTFTPIGTGEETGEVDTPFKGIFDGGGNTISNITYSNSEGVGAGLFGYIYSPAQIKNINLESCSFTGNAYVGAIVGNSAGTETDFGVYNCTVSSTVSVTGTTTDEENAPDIYIGGIIGYCGNLIIQNCISAASVSGSTCVGGIAGLLYEGTIQNCFYTGSSSFNEETKGVIAGDRGGYDEDDNYIVGSEGTINLTLYDADDDATNNATRLGYYNGIENVDVTLCGRTLYKDNSWNTICLPFAMTAAQVTTQLNPTKLMTLSTASFSEGTLTLNFENATTIEAGKPYIIKWASGDDFTPTFEGVTINSADPTDVEGTAANFHGIYSPYSTGGENKSMLYLGADNKLYYPSADMTINAFRAYFTLNNGIEAGSQAGVRALVLNFSDETSGIVDAEANSSLFTLHSSLSEWYTLDGRRLSSKPTVKGLYINNGKKIVIE